MNLANNHFFKINFGMIKGPFFQTHFFLSHKHNKNNSNKNLINNNKNHFMLKSTALLQCFDGMNK